MSVHEAGHEDMSCICNLAIFEAKAVPISFQHGNMDTCLVRMVILKPSNKSVAFALLSDLCRRCLPFSALRETGDPVPRFRPFRRRCRNLVTISD